MRSVFGYDDYEVIRFLMAYVVTGIALVGYDFNTPPIHQKIYILRRQTGVVIITLVLWPIVFLRDGWVEQVLRGRGIRFIVGIVVLFIALFVTSGLLLQFFSWLTGSALATVILSFFVALFVSPVAMAFAMPGWD